MCNAKGKEPGVYDGRQWLGWAVGSGKREGKEVAFAWARRKKQVLQDGGGRCERHRGGVERQEIGLGDLGAAPRAAGGWSSELSGERELRPARRAQPGCSGLGAQMEESKFKPYS